MSKIITQSHKKYLSAPLEIDNHYAETKADLMGDWKDEFTRRIQ